MNKKVIKILGIMLLLILFASNISKIYAAFDFNTITTIKVANETKSYVWIFKIISNIIFIITIILGAISIFLVAVNRKQIKNSQFVKLMITYMFSSLLLGVALDNGKPMGRAIDFNPTFWNIHIEAINELIGFTIVLIIMRKTIKYIKAIIKKEDKSLKGDK